MCIYVPMCLCGEDSYICPMSILITGATGFVGYYLVKDLLKTGEKVLATGRGKSVYDFSTFPNYQYVQLDFTDPFAVHDFFEKYQPAMVIHAGAMSKPDDCEARQWEAYTTNTEGTLTLLMNAAEYKSFFLFLSTDFVFSGNEGMYTEEAERAPVNFYGKTKMEAEDAVMEYEGDWAIARTVLVYGPQQGSRGNLLTVVKDKLQKGETYNVFNDQVRTPTYVGDLVKGLLSIVSKKHTGIFHLSGEDVRTPYEMAVETAAYLGMDTSLIHSTTEAEFIQPAKRPGKTGFNIEKAKRVLGFQPISFQEGMKKTFNTSI